MSMLIFDLDDTLYPVSSIKESTGKPLYESLQSVNQNFKNFSNSKTEEIFKDFWKLTFNEIIYKYKLPETYQKALIESFENLEINHDIKPYEDINALTDLHQDKFLVTTGYKKLQLSKIKKLNISGFFKNIYVDVPSIGKNEKNKKYYFSLIAKKYDLPSSHFIVIGDNLGSEIRFANELNMTSVLVERKKNSSSIDVIPDHKIKNFYDLKKLLLN